MMPCTALVYITHRSTIVDGPEVPEDRDPAQREAEGPRSSMDYSEFPLLDFSHQKKNGAPASPHRVTAVPCDVQWKGQRSRWRCMKKTEYSGELQIYIHVPARRRVQCRLRMENTERCTFCILVALRKAG